MSDGGDRIPEHVLDGFRAQDGRSLGAWCDERPLLLVFLRHFGCVFCREALRRTSALREQIEGCGALVGYVHLGTEEEAAPVFERYGLEHTPRFADPERALYAAFGLPRAGLAQVFGPRHLLRGVQAFLAGNGVGVSAGDKMQLPGAFLLHRGRILRAYRPQGVSDSPDYVALACGEPGTGS